MFEDPEQAIAAIETLVEEISSTAISLPVQERTAYVANRIEAIRSLYRKRFADDAAGLSQALEFASRVEDWSQLRLAQLEATVGTAGRA